MAIDLTSIDLQEFPLFDQVEETYIRKFLSVGFNFTYEPGAQVVSKNDAGETFFMVMKGLAKLVLRNEQQEEFNAALFRTGDFFGEMSILEPGTVRNGDIVALYKLEVVTIHKKDFLKLLQECPMLAFNLARTLAQRIRIMNDRLMTDRLPDEVQKVAHTLVMLARKGVSFQAEGPILLPPLSLKEWALFCYTSGQVFMDSIEQFKQLGALEWQNQRIVITDLTLLQRCAKPSEAGANGQ